MKSTALAIVCSFIALTGLNPAEAQATDYVATVIMDGTGNTVTVFTNASGELVAQFDGNTLNLPPGLSVEISATRQVSNTGDVTYNINAVGTPRPATASEIEIAAMAVSESSSSNTSNAMLSSTPPPDEDYSLQIDINAALTFNSACGNTDTAGQSASC
ncbi:MAG: hypothetical protein AAGI24_07290 [Pseudomonadota bacterium]